VYTDLCWFFLFVLVRTGPYWSVLVLTGPYWWQCVVGVAGGATRAALAVHQARRDNVADVAAKDSSQETLVNGAGPYWFILVCTGPYWSVTGLYWFVLGRRRW
ncbi:hypothetical protein DV515_00017974, partial [Chloebia gouldiae]